MALKLIKKTLNINPFKFNLIHFIPDQKPHSYAIFTHGYTASKGDCLPWANRLSDNGFACSIFDLPGHHLGSYNSVSSFEDFTGNTHTLFAHVLSDLKEHTETTTDRLILGGHSLGALLSLKALNLPDLQNYDLYAIAVGLGQNLNVSTHLFNTSFYEKTLNLRNQLVDECLHHEKMFPWIKQEKENLELKDKKIHLITGQDDVVVGKDGMKTFGERLAKTNTVTMNEPVKLPHHEPTLASPHIYSFIKKELNL